MKEAISTISMILRLLVISFPKWSLCPFIFSNIIFGLAPETIHAQSTYDTAWIRQIGTIGEDKSNSVAIDSLGNIYISGVTNNILGDVSMGNDDVFLMKYDKNGQWIWTRQIGTANYEESLAITTDTQDNIYISGYSTGSLGGTNSNSADAFFLKYDPSGTQLLAQKIGTLRYDSSSAIAVDTSGNIYISGRTDGKIGSSQFESKNVLLVKFNAMGAKLWSQQIGTTSSDEGNAMALDAAGDIYISGYTGGKLLGGTNAGGYDAFLAKHDKTSGNNIWCKQIGTPGNDYSQSIAIDASGNIYISGYTTGSFDGTNAGGEDAFVCKYDGKDGSCLWRRQLGTNGNDRSYSVALDSRGNIYICGTTSGNFDNYLNAGGEDTFLACYDTNGTLLWFRQIGTIGNDICRGIAIAGNDNICITGYTSGSFEGTNAGGNDAFLIQFQPPTSALPVPGDANGDHQVDVGDLGILAASYGQSNRSWGHGDFNKDGIVDVGDLGILAANYGYGTPGTVANFNADYAQTLIKIVGEDNSVDKDINNETGNSACSNLGLPLMTGILLAFFALEWIKD